MTSYEIEPATFCYRFPNKRGITIIGNEDADKYE
jgi:hypothetical protein